MNLHRIENLDPSTRSIIRTEVYRALADYASGGKHGPLSVQALFLRTADGLEDRGVINRPRGLQRFYQLAEKRPNNFPNYGVPEDIANLVRQTFWELHLQGVLAPGPKRDPAKYPDHQLHFDSVMLTPYGVRVLIDSRNRIQVHDPDGYLANFWGAKPEPDYEMMLYLAECVQVFRGGHLLASVVLLGIASERLIEVLAQRLHNASGGTWYNNTYQPKRDISARFKAVEDKLVSAYGNELKAEGLLERFDTAKLAFHEIREARNDVAHPKGRKLTWNEVNGLLFHFVPYFQHINEIIVFLDARS